MAADFTEILLRKKIIDPEQIVEARTLRRQTGGKLQDAIVELGYATTQEVMSAIAESHGIQFIDLTELTIPPAVIEMVPESVARENIVLPMTQKNGILKIILSDPTDSDTILKLQFILNKDIQPVLALPEQIIEAINRHYGPTETESVDSMLAEFDDTAIVFDEAAARSAQDDSDPLIVKLVDLIIQEAIIIGASDIHIEPFADRIRVRCRIDGILVERDSPPRSLLDPLLARLKFLANIARPERLQPQPGRFKRLLAALLLRTKPRPIIARPEHPQPQDGRFKMIVQGNHFDLRVSILPTMHGESVVLRIPNRINIEDLRFDEDDSQRFRQIISRPSGLFLVTGPVGSGKTTTVYAALHELNRVDRIVITAEDPVEYAVAGIAQSQIPHDLTFANTLRSIVRQEPDVLLVGAIRDLKTAQVAVQAALSGCMVFSTLQTTNDASSAISRLVDMGVQPFLIASSVTAILAQRLVRVVCPKCKEPDKPSKAEIRAAGITRERLATANFLRGPGCKYCNYTGYRGRQGIFEMLALNAAIREMIFHGEPTQAIRRQARSLGIRTVLEDGVNKALRGMTTLEEVLSACRHELQTDVAAS